MGRFRFRAWDGKRMSQDLRIQLDTGKIYDAGEYEDFERKYPLMLSTNLFDKKGREIYEGDIVKCDCDMKLGGVDCDYGTVEFNGLTFTLINRYILFGDEVLGGNFLMCVGCPEDYFNDTEIRWEVIGNIFENPELSDITKPKEETK